jgi:hypothetical protein
VDLRLPITRAEFAGVAVLSYQNFTGRHVRPAPGNTYNDTNDYDVLRAYTAQLMDGVGGGAFAPNVWLNREQMATVLTRSFRRWTNPGSTIQSDPQNPLAVSWPALFDDDDNISYWARESVYFMAANDIILGTGNNRFSPRAITAAQEAAGYAQATREQALVIAVRMAENLG